MVFNGRQAIVGSRVNDVSAALNQVRAEPNAPSLSVNNGQVSINGNNAPHDTHLWLVSYDPRTVNIPIRAGENAGRTLPHKNIVLSLTSLGGWKGGHTQYALPPAKPNTAQAVLVQAGNGGPILSALKI